MIRKTLLALIVGLFGVCSSALANAPLLNVVVERVGISQQNDPNFNWGSKIPVAFVGHPAGACSSGSHEFQTFTENEWVANHMMSLFILSKEMGTRLNVYYECSQSTNPGHGGKSWPFITGVHLAP